jgi:hypothetical protein
MDKQSGSFVAILGPWLAEARSAVPLPMIRA